MPSSADRARERAVRFAPPARPPADDPLATEAAAAARARSERIDPIRSTVDLPPARHHGLKAWAGEAAVELGVSKVTSQDVIATLVSRLLTDETLSRKVKADLAEQAATERGPRSRRR